jgi:hypothetical protein
LRVFSRQAQNDRIVKSRHNSASLPSRAFATQQIGTRAIDQPAAEYRNNEQESKPEGKEEYYQGQRPATFIARQNSLTKLAFGSNVIPKAGLLSLPQLQDCISLVRQRVYFDIVKLVIHFPSAPQSIALIDPIKSDPHDGAQS